MICGIFPQLRDELPIPVPVMFAVTFALPAALPGLLFTPALYATFQRIRGWLNGRVHPATPSERESPMENPL